MIVCVGGGSRVLESGMELFGVQATRAAGVGGAQSMRMLT